MKKTLIDFFTFMDQGRQEFLFLIYDENGNHTTQIEGLNLDYEK